MVPPPPVKSSCALLRRTRLDRMHLDSAIVVVGRRGPEIAVVGAGTEAGVVLRGVIAVVALERAGTVLGVIVGPRARIGRALMLIGLALDVVGGALVLIARIGVVVLLAPVLIVLLGLLVVLLGLGRVRRIGPRLIALVVLIA